jgi:uncharacterized protein (TIGR02594 family)
VKHLFGGLVLALSACTITPSIGLESDNSGDTVRTRIVLSNNNPALKAAQYLNYTEVTHRQELKEFTGVDPVRTEWCAAFVNSVLEESNIPSNNDHRYPLTARAFLDWGQRVSKEDIQPGDVVVFPRGASSWQGHVGFYLKTEVINGIQYYLILGGNQSNKVSIVTYRASRALGIRRQSSI